MRQITGDQEVEVVGLHVLMITETIVRKKKKKFKTMTYSKYSERNLISSSVASANNLLRAAAILPNLILEA